MSNVADNRDLQAVKTALNLANRIDIQQPLRRVFAEPVTRIDYARFDIPAQEPRRSAGATAHDHNVNAKGLQVAGGIQQCLALAD